MSDIYTQVMQLSEEARRKVKRQAQTIIAGQAPLKPDYETISDTTLPKRVVWIINALTDSVILCAFIPSAVRLYLAGGAFFYGSTGNAYLASMVGGATVALAEIGQLVFTLARLIAPNDKPLEIPRLGLRLNVNSFILFLAALACTVFALVGNIFIAKPQAHGGHLFAWLETILPPLIVLSAAQVRKSTVMRSILARENAERGYKADLANWQARYDQAQQHPDWTSVYANTIRDALVSANGKTKGERKALRALSADNWRLLVIREWQADNWFTESERKAQEVVSEAPSEPEIKRDKSSGGNERNGTSASMVYKRDGNWHVKRCPCNETFDKVYASEVSAQNAYSGHIRKSAKHAAYALKQAQSNHKPLEIEVEGLAQ